jgi:hypothetical protein
VGAAAALDWRRSWARPGQEIDGETRWCGMGVAASNDGINERTAAVAEHEGLGCWRRQRSDGAGDESSTGSIWRHGSCAVMRRKKRRHGLVAKAGPQRR